MALLGLKKKQAFGQVPMMGAEPMTMGAPVQGMGQMADITNMPAMAQQPMQEEGKRKPNWLGIVGDSLQILGGGQATYVPQMREQQQRAEMMRQRALEAQQARETKWQDYVREAEYDRENAAPKAPDQLTQYMINAGIDPTSDQGRQIFKTAVMNKTNPFQEMVVTNADGSQERKIFRPGMPTTPLTDDDWNSAAPLGGPTPPASGIFPGR